MLTLTTVALDSIRPYWRNPRQTGGAVAAVKVSIEQFGFNQPIIVDKNNVIIAGHVRYQALRELGQTTAPCVVLDLTEEQAKRYRIADNKTSEFASWDDEKLRQELAEMSDPRVMAGFFKPGAIEALMASLGATDFTPVTSEAIIAGQERLSGQMQARSEAKSDLIGVICPKCTYEFFLNKEALLNNTERDYGARDAESDDTDSVEDPAG